MNVTEDHLIGVALDWVKHNTRDKEATNGIIKKDTDLLATGVLDSIGFIDLISFLEHEADCQIDLSDMDPDDFTTVHGLCCTALNNGD